MNKKSKKPILLLDFDGVLHSYSSGWKGARNIPDPPVDGALQFLIDAQDTFQVCIYSSRSRQFGGKHAMKKWLREHYEEISGEPAQTPEFFYKWISETAFADPWEHEVEYAITRLLRCIKFPTKKPAAFMTIDDRAICFDGKFPDLATLTGFKPWNKRTIDGRSPTYVDGRTIDAIYCLLEALSHGRHRNQLPVATSLAAAIRGSLDLAPVISSGGDSGPAMDSAAHLEDALDVFFKYAEKRDGIVPETD